MRIALSGRSLGLLLFTLALAALGGALFLQAPPAERTSPGAGPRFDLRAAPERATLAALRRTLAAGVTTLRLDVRRGPGGTPVLRGDRAVDDAPTLAQALALTERRSGGRLHYAVAVGVRPDDGTAPSEIAAAVLQAVRGAGVAARTTIRALDWRVLAHVRTQAPEVGRTYATAERDRLDTVQRGQDGASPWLDGLDVDAYGASVPRTIAAAETPAGGTYAAPPPWRVVWSPYVRDLRPADLRRAHALGLKVVPWGVADRATMDALLADGVDGLVTPYPARARAAMQARGLSVPPQVQAD